MCVEWVHEWETAREDIIAYKCVRRNGDHFVSPCKLQNRAHQGVELRGAIFTYRIGKKVKSAEPGIYCVTEPMKLLEDDMAIVEVIIPKGTKFRRGRAGVRDENDQLHEMRTLNAFCVKVIKEYKGKAKAFGWPVSTGTTITTWSYITVASNTTATVWQQP